MRNSSRRRFIREFAGGAALFGTLSMLSNLVSATSRGPNSRAPAMFIGHGDPMNATKNNAATKEWERIAKLLSTRERPAAILCVSAHWESQNTMVSTAATPELIYDFYGFPKFMYKLKYPAPGFPKSNTLINDTLSGKSIVEDPKRGLDHGAWSVLSRLYPDADIPVFQVSLARSLNAEEHYSLAKQISVLRDKGVMIIGSGNLTHNMRSWQRDSSLGQTHLVHDWAEAFDQAVAEAIVKGDHKTLIRIAQQKPSLYLLAHPTSEHYLPIIYALAAQHNNDNLEFFAETFEEGSFSMRSFLLS